MAYLGNQPALSYTSFAKQDFTTSATTSYTLDNPVANANELALFINFVRQEPTTAYSASGTTLTLTSATSASDDMYCVYLGKAVQTVNPPNASVGLSQLTATGTKDATTFLRGDNTFAVAGGTNEAEFSVIIAGSGSTNIATSTATIIPFGSEEFDPDGVFNTSTYKFTAPSAGKYFFSWCVRKNNFSSGRFFIDIYKNSTGVGTFETGNGSSDYGSVGGTILLDLAQNDTVHGEVVHNQGGTQAITNNNTRFFGFKLIG